MKTWLARLVNAPASIEERQKRITVYFGFCLALTGVICAAGALALALAAAENLRLPALLGIGTLSLAAGGLCAWLMARARHDVSHLVNSIRARQSALQEYAQLAGESEDYLNAIVRTMAGCLVIIGPDATIKTVNQATLDLTGYDENELLGQPIEILFDSGTFRSSEDKLSKHGFIRHGERTYKTKDGRVVPVSFSSAIMRDANKRVLGIVCVAQDITSLKQVGDELQQRLVQLGILHQVDEELTHTLSIDNVLTMALDITMRLSVAHAGAISMVDTGHLIPVQAIGYPPEVPEASCASNGLVLRAAKQQEAELILDVNADADYVAVLPSTRCMMTIPLLSQDRLVGVLHLEGSKPERFTSEIFQFLQLITARIAVAIDNAQLYATSRRQLEQLQDLYDQVSALEQIKTDMIRIAAHDLRNPLNNLAMSTRLLRRTAWERLTEDERERIVDIEESTIRMQKVTSNILSLERIATSVTGEFRTVVDLLEVVRQAFEAHRAQARTKNQEYVLMAPEEPVYVQGESIELHEAAVNFISNAIKYTPEHGRIVVSLKQSDIKAICEVIDTGYGIPEDQQERLFQPFYRARSAETQTIDGTGLGLHLVKNIVERHQGRIRFRSKYGEGSTFGFELPLIPQASSSPASPHAANGASM